MSVATGARSPKNKCKGHWPSKAALKVAHKCHWDGETHQCESAAPHPSHRDHAVQVAIVGKGAVKEEKRGDGDAHGPTRRTDQADAKLEPPPSRADLHLLRHVGVGDPGNGHIGTRQREEDGDACEEGQGRVAGVTKDRRVGGVRGNV